MNKKHVIIVEDQALVALDLSEILDVEGYIVDYVCSNAQEAMQMIPHFMPDIVLLDIVLHGEMDGTQIAPIIQNEYGIPVIYISAHSNDEMFNRAKITCPYGFVAKPIIKNSAQRQVFRCFNINKGFS